MMTDEQLRYIRICIEQYREVSTDDARTLLAEVDRLEELRQMLCDERDAWQREALRLRAQVPELEADRDHARLQARTLDNARISGQGSLEADKILYSRARDGWRVGDGKEAPHGQ